MTPLLQVSGICKRYGAIEALRWDPSDTLVVQSGEVLGLAGENGAGKSTLVRAIAGMEKPDEGTMELMGRPYAPHSSVEARRLGVAAVLQEPALLPNLTVAENLFIEREPILGRSGVVNGRALRRNAERLLDAFGEHIDPTARTASLTLEDRKIVELVRALDAHPQLLIIDEATAALSRRGVDALFRAVREQVSRGGSVLYISHFLEELFDLCDRVFVLRDGQVRADRRTSELDQDELTTLMVGRDVSLGAAAFERQVAPQAEGALECREMTLDGAFSSVSFALRKGEIVGLGGLEGCGARQVAMCVAGALRPSAGTMLLFDEPFAPSSCRGAIQGGVGYVPRDREEEGLILTASVADNVVLPMLDRLSRFAVLAARVVRRVAREAIGQARVKAESPGVLAGHLSGGNRQKVIISRWMVQPFKLLVLDNPTRGVDVGAKAEIHDRLEEMRRRGGTILIVTAEMPELRRLCDRILIMRRGQLVREFPAGATEEQLIASMV